MAATLQDIIRCFKSSKFGCLDPCSTNWDKPSQIRYQALWEGRSLHIWVSSFLSPPAPGACNPHLIDEEVEAGVGVRGYLLEDPQYNPLSSFLLLHNYP